MLRRTKIILICYCISRLLLVLTPPNLFEFHNFSEIAEQLLNGSNPFVENSLRELAYSPLIYLIVASQILVFGNNWFAYNIIYLYYDLGMILILYKISLKIQGNRGDISNKILFYAFFPLTIFQLTNAYPSWIVVFFLSLTLYMYMDERYLLTGICAGLGFLIEVAPVFLVYLIGIKLLATRKIKELTSLISGFAASVVLIGLICFNFDIGKVMELFLIHFTRKASAIPIFIFLPQIELSLMWGFTLNGFTLIPLIGSIIFGAFFYHSIQSQKEMPIERQLTYFLVFFLILPFEFLNLNIRFFLWILPFFFILGGGTITDRNLKTNLYLLLILLSIQTILLITSLRSFPFDAIDFSLYSFLSQVFTEYISITLFSISAIIIVWYIFWYNSIDKTTGGITKTKINSLIPSTLISSLLFVFEYAFYVITADELLRSIIVISFTTTGLYFIGSSIIKFWDFFEIQKYRMKPR